MKITTGTIVRTIMIVIVVINFILKAIGKPVIDIEEGTVAAYVEVFIEVAMVLVGFWKNNSFSEAAIKADEFLKSLKSGETGAGPMTFDKFVSTYNGKGTDYDGAYGVQCVDLIKLYLDKVFGIKAGSWGNAKYYWLNFEKISELKNNFTKISNTASFVPQKGDIMVWNGKVGSGCGHVAICTGEGTTSYFYSYDQNWNGKKMHKVKHGYDNVYGVLRPKDQSGISNKGTTPYSNRVQWLNGSTEEKFFRKSNLSDKFENINPRVGAWCYGKYGGNYLIVTTSDGGKHATAGFVEYAGGIKTIPTGGKTYKNGSTSETVYADVDKKTVIGSLNKNESCICLAKIDGMYLVAYKVDGSDDYKTGFVVYDGGVE